MKNLFSALIVLLICGMVIVPMVSAAGTDYGTRITNRVQVGGLNFTAVNTSMSTQVRGIAGARWLAQADDQGANPGSWQTNITSLTNLGNGSYVFQLSVGGFTTNATGGNFGAWSWQIITNSVVYSSGTGNGAFGGNITLAEGSSKAITFRAQVSASATSATQSWQLIAQATTPHVNTAAYTGDNGTLYGGNFGAAIADRAVIYGTGSTFGPGDTYYTITTAASPLITVSKTITSIVTAGAGPDGIAIPGATITYQIKVTNAVGAGPASGVVVRDTADTNNLMTLGGQAAAGTEANWSMSIAGNLVKWSNTEALFEAGNAATLTFTAIIK